MNLTRKNIAPVEWNLFPFWRKPKDFLRRVIRKKASMKFSIKQGDLHFRMTHFAIMQQILG